MLYSALKLQQFHGIARISNVRRNASLLVCNTVAEDLKADNVSPLFLYQENKSE
jgi:hypothetical protein